MAGARPRTMSLAGKEPAEVWMQRVREFQRIRKQTDDKRTRYRNALALDLGHIYGLGANQLDVHLPFRIWAYYAAQAFDEFPELRYPRGGQGDGAFGPVVEKVLTGDLDAAGVPETFRTVIADILTDGGSAVWYGLPRFPGPGDVATVNWGINEAVESIKQGGYDPTPGMDHQFIADRLFELASDADRMLGLPMGVQVEIHNHRIKHLQALEDEDRNPSDWRLEDGQFWAERSLIGVATAWDTTVSDLRYARWMARRILLPLDEAQSQERFNAAGRKLIRPLHLSETEPDTIRTSEMPDSAAEEEYSRAAIWHFYDRKHETQHFVAESAEREGVSYYLEEDETYPYLDLETEEPEIKGFFPCQVIAPYKHNIARLDRTWGVPLLEIAWPQIEQVIRLETEVSAQSKRNVRIFGFHKKVDGVTRQRICAGEDAVGVDVDDVVWKEDPNGIGVRVLTMPSVSADLRADRDRSWRVLSSTVGVPYTALTGESAEPTLGQEELAAAAGGQQTGDMVGQLESGFAGIAEGARAIARLSKTPEDVRRMLGEKAAELWAQFVESDVRTDKLRARFAHRVRDEDPRKVAQLMQALQLVLEAPQLMLDPMPIVEDLWRAFGLGEPQFRAQSQDEKMALAEKMMGLAKLRQEAQGGAAPAPESRAPTPNEPATVPDPSAQAAATGREPALI